MLVRERMSRPVVTISPGDDFQRGLSIMQAQRLRRLPVIDGDRLVGIVAERDLLLAALHYLQSRVEIGDVMTQPVITAAPQTTLAEAARTMLAHRIGGLPVVDGDALVGIITETDIFRRFVELADD